MTFDDFECYVMHYTGHTHRKKFLQRQFAKEDISCIFVEDFDREQITYQEFVSWYKTYVMEYMRRSHQYFGFGGITLKPEEVSLSLKHVEAMRLFLQESDKPYMLVFEDDVIICQNFKNRLNSYLESLPKNWSAAFIGQGAGKRIESRLIQPNLFWYRKDYPSDRCTDSILFTRDTVEQIYTSILDEKMAYPIDHELSYIFRKLKSNVYWLEPPIVAQGSQTGFFGTFQDAMSGFYEDKSIKMRDDMEDLLS